MADEVSVERVIAASPDDLWARVADIERMGDLSPESAGGKWLKGATGPAVGAKFKGENRNGKKQWSTTGTVVVCEPGRVFVFDVTSGPVKVSRWGYRFEPTDGGCKVVETWTDQRGWLPQDVGQVDQRRRRPREPQPLDDGSDPGPPGVPRGVRRAVASVSGAEVGGLDRRDQVVGTGTSRSRAGGTRGQSTRSRWGRGKRWRWPMKGPSSPFQSAASIWWRLRRPKSIRISS